jgi:hypothetical protein
MPPSDSWSETPPPPLLSISLRDRHIARWTVYFLASRYDHAVDFEWTEVLIKLRRMNKRKLPHVFTMEAVTKLTDNYYPLKVTQPEEKLNLPN